MDLRDTLRADFYHSTGNERFQIIRFFRDYGYRYVFYLRLCGANRLFKLLVSVPRRRLSLRHSIEISPDTSIGGGLHLVHPYGITLNRDVVMGRNVNLHKGCTIGQENRGRRKGSPTICDRVWIGMNAAIVGNVTIGEDVLVAPNAYVNFDVPAHSIVVGNPGRIIPCANATKDYIINIA